jgi:hypothetical protein
MGFQNSKIFAQNPLVLAYGFTINSQFAAKTDKNLVFLGCGPNIPHLLYIMVPYMSFRGFSIYSNFRSKSIGAYGFTINRHFATKNDQNFIFLSHDPHIRDRLYIMVPYMSFYRFSKFSKFHSNSIDVSLQFYRKSLVCGKNWSKLSISWSWPPYSPSVIHNNYMVKDTCLDYSLTSAQCLLLWDLEGYHRSQLLNNNDRKQVIQTINKTVYQAVLIY